MSKLVNFIEDVNPQKLHLFMAGPFGLMAFIGHYWNQIGIKTQCYEYLRRNTYAPSYLLE